jgi:phosphatidate cytidylyltransferase
VTDAALWQLAQVLAGLLAFGTVVVLVLSALGRGRGLWTAYAAEPLVVVAVLVPAYLGGVALLAALLVIGLLATRELARALGLAGLPPLEPVALAGAAAVLGAAVQAPGALVPVLAVSLAAALAVPLLRGRGPAVAASTTLAVVYPALGLAAVGLIAGGENGFGRVLFMYALVELNDVFALLGGRLLGRRRPWPSLSPNKTLEGAAIGVLASLGGALVFGFAVPEWSTANRLALGLAVGLAVPVGDLVASAIKRAAGLKDYAALVPGSGGVLDVYDSLVFAAVLFYALTA